MNQWVIKYFKLNIFTVEDLKLFLSVGDLTQEEFNELTANKPEV